MTANAKKELKKLSILSMFRKNEEKVQNEE